MDSFDSTRSTYSTYSVLNLPFVSSRRKLPGESFDKELAELPFFEAEEVFFEAEEVNHFNEQ
jgi:hypothetical protein